MRILYDSKNPIFKAPFGALRAGEPCRICLHIPLSCETAACFLVLEKDGGGELRFSMAKSGEAGGYEIRSVGFSLPEPGLYFYYFLIEVPTGPFRLFRYGYADTNMEDGERWQLTCYPADYQTPSAFAGATMMQIFPDRFYAAKKHDLSDKLTPFTLHEKWGELPEWRPNEKGEITNSDFFGGDLAGITEKLSYLKDLGIEVIYLNPIFKAYSNHRYDTADYHKIDPLLGTEEDFRILCRRAHRMGMRVILDGVFSHTGENSAYFRSAVSDPGSPYRAWYDFQKWPDEYTSWWGIKTLPCVIEENESYRDFILNEKTGVAAHWLRAGADGFRLDVADELPDSFIAGLRRTVKAVKPDALLLGEVWEDASNKISYGARRAYFTAGELDGVMNYPFRTAILDLMLGRDHGEKFEQTVMGILENYPPPALPTLMNFLSTHDTPRALTLLGEPPEIKDKAERAQYALSAEKRQIAEKRLICASFLQVMLPGMVSVFYGDEIGTEGFEDPFCRACFDWAKADSPLRARLKEIYGLRKRHPALKTGDTSVKSDQNGRIVLTRSLGRVTLRATVNVSGEPVSHQREGKVLMTGNCDGDRIFPYGFILEKL